jgi:threonine synthase
MAKAFREMQTLGWIGDRLPRLVSVQVAGCAPIVKAWDAKAGKAEAWPNATTLAAGLRVPSPFADTLILDGIRSTHGTAVAVTEDEMFDAMIDIASAEGCFVCPEGAATFAALRQLLASGEVKRGERVVIYDTGSGLKYPEAWRAAIARRQAAARA